MQRIIDFHTHPFLTQDSNICNHKTVIHMQPEDMPKTFAGLGVEKICGSALLLQDPKNPIPVWEQIRRSNDIALQLREMLGDFYYPGCHIHPDYPKESLEEIRRFAEKGFRLVGELVPYIHNWSDYSCKEFGYLLDACGECGMVVSMHSLNDEEMDRMVLSHKHVTMVMAHPGELDSFLRHLQRMDMSENYYLDVSGTGLFRHGMLARGIAEQGADRFLFGSDYPTCNPAMFVGGVLLDELISREDKEKILYTNAKKLLHLD